MQESEISKARMMQAFDIEVVVIKASQSLQLSIFYSNRLLILGATIINSSVDFIKLITI